MGLLKHLDIQPDSVAWQLVLSVAWSCLAFALLFTLDGMEDAAGHEESARSLTRSMTMALSLLMGISWERTIEECIQNLASLGRTRQTTVSSLGTDHLSHRHGPLPLAIQLATSLALVAIVVPAVRVHILRKAYRYSKLRSEVEPTIGQSTEVALGVLRNIGSECTVPRTTLQQTPLTARGVLSPRRRGTLPRGLGGCAY